MTEHQDENNPTRTHLLLARGQAVHQYRIVERIGAGGMGTVYLADDTALKRRVALKFLPADRAEDDSSRTRFVREAQAAAALNHPNVIHIYEVGEFQQQPFIAMEHVEGRSLRDFIGADRTDLAHVLDLMIGICDGLQKAHANGVVHRDIKPQNIVVDSDGRPKVLDFGLAAVRGAEKLTRDGTTVGTVAYMSPEQVEGKEIDARSDLFSAGVVLYELLTGRSPFRRDGDGATLAAIIHDEPEPLARFRRALPEGLQQIVDKALDKHNSTRYQSAADMRADLIRERRLIESRVSVSRSAPGAVMRSRSKTRLWVSSVFAVALVVLLLVLQPWHRELGSSDEARTEDNRLAVMYFDNLIDPEDPGRLGEIVTNLLITDLSESTEMRVLSSQRLYDILTELGDSGGRVISRDLATRVAKRARANLMLTGTILQTEPRLVITAQVIEVATGQVDFSHRITGEADEDLFAQTDRLAGAIRQAMHIEAMAGEQSHALESITTRSPEAYRLYLEGVEAHRQLFSDRARDRINEAIALDSNFAEAYFYMATSLLSHPEDRKYIELAKAHSENASPLLRRKIKAAASLIDGHTEAALAELRELVQQYPDDIDAYIGIHSMLVNLNRRAEAIEVLEKVLRIDPRERMALNQLAYLCKRERRLDEALQWADRYVAVTPYEPNPYDTRGEILADMGRIEEALASFERAYAVDTMFASALMHAFWVHLFEGRLDTAAVLAERMSGYDNPAAAWMVIEARSAIFELRGQNRRALAFLDDWDQQYGQAGTANPGRPTVLPFKTGIFLRLEAYDSLLTMADALEKFESGGAVWPLVLANMCRAATYAHQGRADDAWAVFESMEPYMMRWGPLTGLPDYLMIKGEVALALGELATAIEALEEGIALKGDAPYFNAITLAEAYLEAGRAAEAAALLAPYLTSLPKVEFTDVAEIHCWVGKAKERLGRPADAREHYRQALERWEMADGSDPLYRFANERYAELAVEIP